MDGTPIKSTFMKNKQSYRTVFISDVHLGFRGSNTEKLISFLKSTHADSFYLLGDIIDIWSFKETHFWIESHTEVIKILLKKAKKSRIIFVPGNHDHDLRQLNGISFGNISIQNEVIHDCQNGMKILCTHGDLFDSVIQDNKWLVAIGCFLYDKLIVLSHYLSNLRQVAGRVHWSLSEYLKHKVKIATNYIGDFEGELIRECKSRGFDGVICGHIHHAEIREIEDSSHGDTALVYMNTGDWVESLTAIVEDHDGTFRILEWNNGKMIEVKQYVR